MHSQVPVRRQRHAPVLARTGAGALAALACAALLGACGSSNSSSSSTTRPGKPNLNIARVERSIEQSIRTERKLASTVTCPQFVTQEPGVTFECVATTASPKKKGTLVKTPFVVTVENKSGFVSYTGK